MISANELNSRWLTRISLHNWVQKPSQTEVKRTRWYALHAFGLWTRTYSNVANFPTLKNLAPSWRHAWIVSEHSWRTINGLETWSSRVLPVRKLGLLKTNKYPVPHPGNIIVCKLRGLEGRCWPEPQVFGIVGVKQVNECLQTIPDWDKSDNFLQTVLSLENFNQKRFLEKMLVVAKIAQLFFHYPDCNRIIIT